MPDMYQDGEYDIAGFSVGIAEKSQLISAQNVKAGQAVIGLSSSGIHSNGFSLVRKILFKDNHVSLSEPFDGSTIGETILTPTKIYVKSVMAVLQKIQVSGIAHITGGGFIENMPRCLQDTQGLSIKKGSWKIPPIFSKLQDLGKIAESEMYNVFNMGIGMILIVDQKDVDQALSILSSHGETAQVIGEVTHSPGILFV